MLWLVFHINARTTKQETLILKSRAGLLSALLVLQLLLPMAASALVELNDGQMKQVHAQAGISIAATGAVVCIESTGLGFTTVNNMDPFGIATPEAGYFSLNDVLGLATVDGVAHVDMGIYSAPAESLFVTDIAKGSATDEFPFEHLYQGISADTGLAQLQADPFYWAIGDDVARPLDNRYGVVQIQVAEFSSRFDLSADLLFCGNPLGSVGVSGLRMPGLVQDGSSLPGSVVTLFPGPGSSINLELRLRVTVDELQLSGTGASSLPDLMVTGVHLGEAFGAELPDHLEDTGDGAAGGIDTSTWAGDITPRMHSGYFLVGNLNQVDFTDSINLAQLVSQEGTTLESSPDGFLPVGLVANPLSFNITTTDTRAHLSVTTGISGSLRMESVAGWDSSDMGPVAIDGMRVTHCLVEFPGEYQRADGSFKGRIHDSQLEWLNNLK